jgi:hypothetical protein
MHSIQNVLVAYGSRKRAILQTIYIYFEWAIIMCNKCNKRHQKADFRDDFSLPQRKFDFIDVRVKWSRTT